MNRLGKGVEEAVRGTVIGGKVHHDLGARRGGAGNLDIEHDFPIVAIGGARGIGSAVHRHRYHGRRWQAEAGEIGLQIVGTVSAAELDYTYGLSGSVYVGRKIIE